MKPHYNQAKGNRLNYNFWLITVEFPDEHTSNNRVMFDALGDIYFVDQQDELVKSGRPSVYDSVQMTGRWKDDLWLKKDASFKSGMRLVNRIKPYLATGSLIIMNNNFQGHDVKFYVNNPDPKPTNMEFALRPGYSRLTNSDHAFDLLTTTLREAGYLVEVEIKCQPKYHDVKIQGPWEGDYWSGNFTGHNITGAFSQETKDSLHSLCGRVGAEHYDYFNKWSHVPVNMPIPTNAEQMAELLAALKAEGEYVTVPS